MHLSWVTSLEKQAHELLLAWQIFVNDDHKFVIFDEASFDIVDLRGKMFWALNFHLTGLHLIWFILHLLFNGFDLFRISLVNLDVFNF